uniref:Uncharacterized protein n=1 Tax=Romanomermis culicivorax TaxID=13658 RepID=A0A915IYG9_ROMCU
MSRSYRINDEIFRRPSASMKQCDDFFFKIKCFKFFETSRRHTSTFGHSTCPKKVPFQALYNKFELTAQTKPINVVYMFYGALLTLSYTSKLQGHNVEALLVRKTGAGLKILISYKTARPEYLLIKVLSLDFRHRPEKLMPFSSILAKNIYEKLRSIRGERLTADIFRQTFRNYQHLAVYQMPDGHME